jgi:hypothetical protein
METFDPMSRGPQTFKQGDVAKALKGALNAGLTIRRFEIDKDGKIIVITGGAGELASANEWDEVK